MKEAPKMKKMPRTNGNMSLVLPIVFVFVKLFACDGALARATRRVEAEVAADTRSIARGHYQSAF